ncbi:hypothetical protein Q3G72_019363 [Acer saccharum]|nr:hypothetical protein Q3G72_019363 [Acer saccharum]
MREAAGDEVDLRKTDTLGVAVTSDLAIRSPYISSTTQNQNNNLIVNMGARGKRQLLGTGNGKQGKWGKVTGNWRVVLSWAKGRG